MPLVATRWPVTTILLPALRRLGARARSSEPARAVIVNDGPACLPSLATLPPLGPPAGVAVPLAGQVAGGCRVVPSLHTSTGPLPPAVGGGMTMPPPISDAES